MTKVLLGEIDDDATHLALVRPGGRPGESMSRKCDNLDELKTLLDEFLTKAGRPPLLAGAFCAPGPVRDDAISLTYSALTIDRPWLRKTLNVSRIHLVNVTTAHALAVSGLPPGDLESVGAGAPVHEAPIGIIGPWRGLGVCTLAPDTTGEWFPLPGEGGHVAVAATNQREADVLASMRQTLGRVSADEVATKKGLVNLQNALARLASAAPLSDVEAVITAASAGESTAVEAVALFTGFVGDVAGNLALTVGARGGIYVFSRMMSAHKALFDRNLLRARFEDKGLMSGFMQQIPLTLVSTRQAGLLGLATLFSSADTRRL